MHELMVRGRDERGAVTAEYAALSAMAASGIAIIVAIRWGVEHHDMVIRFLTMVVEMIMRLVGLR